MGANSAATHGLARGYTKPIVGIDISRGAISTLARAPTGKKFDRNSTDGGPAT